MAQASGHSEGAVSELMAKFTQMRAQMLKMGRMMALSSPENGQVRAWVRRCHLH